MGRRSEPNFSYTFDSLAAVFRDLNTGRFVANKTVLGIMEAEINTTFSYLDNFMTATINGQATPAQFQSAFATKLREQHYMMSALGKGGRGQLTANDIKRVEKTVASELKHFNKLVGGLQSGEISEAQARARMNMYGNKVWNSYWETQTTARKKAGNKLERRVLQPAEHCGDCIALADKGWSPIGSLPDPGDGSTQCLSNCKCSKEYRK